MNNQMEKVLIDRVAVEMLQSQVHSSWTDEKNLRHSKMKGMKSASYHR